MSAPEILPGHKRAALAILFGLAALILAALAPVVGGAVDGVADLRADQARLAALQGKKRDAQALKARRDELQAAISAAAVLYPAARPAVAAERFAESVRAAGAAHAVDVERLQPAGMIDAAGLKAVRLELTARVPPENVAAFLAALEALSPPAFVDRVRVAAPAGAGDPRIEMTASLRTYARPDPRENGR